MSNSSTKINLKKEFLATCEEIQVGRSVLPKVTVGVGIEPPKFRFPPTFKFPEFPSWGEGDDWKAVQTRHVKVISPEEAKLPLCPPEWAILRTNALGIDVQLRMGHTVHFFDFYKRIEEDGTVWYCIRSLIEHNYK